MKRLIALMICAAPFFFAFGQDHEHGHEGHNHPPPPPSPQNQEKLDLKVVSYILGNQFGVTLKKDGIVVEADELIRGLMEGLEGHSEYKKEDVQRAMAQLQEFIREKRRMAREKLMVENAEKAKAFLEENKKKEGVVTLASGLQYKVINKGSGAQPTAVDQVKVHYAGRLIDGSTFDSSYKTNQPATFRVNGVIKGWVEALQMMKEGSKWEIYVPPEIGYGQRGSGRNVPPNAALIFEIELLEVVK